MASSIALGFQPATRPVTTTTRTQIIRPRSASDSDSISDIESVWAPEPESKSQFVSIYEQEQDITALPTLPNAVLTALPSLYEPKRNSQRYSRSFDSWLVDGVLDHDGRPLPNEEPTFRQKVLRYLSRIYGSTPADPALMRIPHVRMTNPPKGIRLILILASGALPYVVAIIDDTIIATIIPVLVNEFKAPQEIGWYASSYFLPLTIFMPLVGKCYSLWNIKWIFFGSIVILLVGSIVCASARTSSMFIAGRVIAGSGAAGIINGAMRVIGISSDRKARTFLEATGALFMGVCTVSGPILGGVISVHIGWRWAFWVNVPIAVSSLAVIALIFPAEANQAALARLPLSEKIIRLDPFGSSMLITSLVLFITLLQNISTTLSFSSQDGALAAFTAICFAGFIGHEICIRPDLALIPRHIIRHRAVWTCCIALFLLFAGWMNFIFFLSIFFQTVLGDTAQESAFNLLPYVVAVSICACITAVTVSWVRYYNPLFVVGAICFAAGAGLTMTFDATTPLSTRIGYEALMGIGVGFLILGNVAPCQTFLDEKDHAVANGLTFFSSLLGATVSLPISNALFNRTLISKITHLNISPYVQALILLDPTKIREDTPEEQLPDVIDALVSSVRQTFILGLAFAILCGLVFLLVPWKPLLMEDKSTTEETTVCDTASNYTRRAPTVWSTSSHYTRRGTTLHSMSSHYIKRDTKV